MKNIKTFESFSGNNELSEELLDKIKSEYDLDDARGMFEVDTAESYGWEDTDRWNECDSESDWCDSYGFASEEVDEKIIDDIVHQFNIDDTEENRDIIKNEILL